MTKAELKEYSGLVRELKEVEQRREESWSRILGPKAVSYTPRVGSDKTQEDLWIEVMEEVEKADKEYIEILKKILQKKASVEKAILTLDKSIERRIMAKRYLEGKGWRQVGEEVGYSRQNINEIHGLCLRKLSEV